jgi:hypothetical protein
MDGLSTLRTRAGHRTEERRRSDGGPDHQAWLAEAGFEDVSFQPTPSPATLVFAR